MTPQELATARLWKGRLTHERFRKALRHVQSRAHFEAALRAIPSVADRDAVQAGMRPLVEARFR